MPRRKDLAIVRVAAGELIASRQALRRETTWLRDGFERYRPAILVGGGFVAGMLIGRKQFSSAARSIASTANLSLALLRSSLGSMLIAATVRKVSSPDSPLRPPPDHQG